MAENKDGGKKIPAWATRLPFGLCKRYGIALPDDATPRDAWNALKRKGFSRTEIYSKIREKGKPSANTTINEPVKQEEPKNTFVAETEKAEKKTSRERFVELLKEKHKRENERFYEYMDITKEEFENSPFDESKWDRMIAEDDYYTVKDMYADQAGINLGDAEDSVHGDKYVYTDDDGVEHIVFVRVID